MDVAITHAVGAVVLGAVYANTLPRDAPYLASPLWVGIPPALVRAVAVAQVAALGGLLAWVVLVARGAAPDADARLLAGASAAFYAASALWPWHARRLVARPTYARALRACAPLWVAGAAVAVLASATRASVAASVALVPVVVVAVGCDAVVWSAAAIFLAHRQA